MSREGDGSFFHHNILKEDRKPLPEEPTLLLDRVAAGYGRHVVLQEVSFSLYSGEILTLIGPNGAGKSTLLKTLTRRLQPLGGRIVLGGRDLTAYKEGELAREAALLLTRRPLPERVTCRDVVELGRAPYTGLFGKLSAEDRRRVEEAMELTGVSYLAEKDFLQVSDGEGQLVMLARALCQDPKILLLDEPTSYLDIRHKVKLLSILRELTRTAHLSVILSLHELDLAQKISDRVACVKDGRITALGRTEEVFGGSAIESLYDMEAGSYIAQFAAPELEAPSGEPRVFVIGGGGEGIDCYRMLQRKGIPFVAGVLQENDLDFPVARALAVKVLSVPAFEAVGEEAIAEAEVWMDRCGKVLCPLTKFGTMNEGNHHLLAIASKKGYSINVI